MPWKEQSRMSLRKEFVDRVSAHEVSMAALCREYDISRKTGYKWLKRFREGTPEALQDRPRRPHGCPWQTEPELEEQILAVRDENPAWGPRKIRAYLTARTEGQWPAPSTIAAILRRNGRIDPEEARKHQPYTPFVMEHPNELWQTDFKGHFSLDQGERCHPLSVLDDCSRFALGLFACPNERRETVQQHLTQVFRVYGLPERMLMDNGAPWGDSRHGAHTILTVWLIRLGIEVCHGRPYHPQTQGKVERFHRTLEEELLERYTFGTLAPCQQAFDAWRQKYNSERPHEALGLQPPSTRYVPSERTFPERLPPVEYDQGEIVRKVDAAGKIYFRNHIFHFSKAFRRQLVALRPGPEEGLCQVFYCRHLVGTIDLRRPAR